MQQFLDKPSINFGAVRDGRRSMPLWLDVDLTAARSIAAGSALSVNIAGNSFYIDQDTANVGSATVHFQDTNLGASSAPLFVSAGFIANVPFTQLLIENAAQAGKRLRIFYGVDIDFQAGINASIAISGTVAVTTVAKTVAQDSKIWTQSYKSTTAMGANAADPIFLAAANVNGAEIVRADIFCITGGGAMQLIAKNGAPAGLNDGTVLCTGFAASTNPMKIEQPLYVPPGVGLYHINAVAESTANRSVLWRFL
ncbi:hypothetical protein [uncultured Dechloromonas sp.]|uniref:hypothetical protein n=1 Tax=uncultured Dechloromonas sp. TaxID=171719 RepID=UPI0025FC6FD0|nr:hypothetical protein [uncultured Dechloromonas sp.]